MLCRRIRILYEWVVSFIILKAIHSTTLIIILTACHLLPRLNRNWNTEKAGKWLRVHWKERKWKVSLLHVIAFAPASCSTFNPYCWSVITGVKTGAWESNAFISIHRKSLWQRFQCTSLAFCGLIMFHSDSIDFIWQPGIGWTRMLYEELGFKIFP